MVDEVYGHVDLHDPVFDASLRTVCGLPVELHGLRLRAAPLGRYAMCSVHTEQWQEAEARGMSRSHFQGMPATSRPSTLGCASPTASATST